MAVFIAEPELGLSETSLPDLRSMVGRLPFEGAMRHVALLMARLEPRLNDPAGHWEIAQQFYGSRPDLLSAYQRVLSKHPTRTVFSPQPLLLLMRLMLEHARHEPMRELTESEFHLLQDSVLGAHSAMEVALDAMGLPTRDAILAYELQAATLFRRPQLLEEMARHQELLRLASADDRLKDPKNRVPVAAWLAVSGVAADEQWALGFGLSAITHAFVDPVRPHALAPHVDDLLRRLGLPEPPLSLPVIAASRAELDAAFRALGGGDETLAWETRPVKSKPFLQLTNGDLLLLSPSWLLSWLGEGFHYRALAQAQRESKATSAKYTRLAGEAVERYALDLAEAAVVAPDRVFGEQSYDKGGGKKTSDVAVVAGDGRDLVLFEIHARRVAATAAVSGTAAEASMEVSRLLVEKADQLGPCVSALLEKRATYPGTKIDDIERIWPVVVSVGHVMQTTNLWGYIRSSMDVRKAASLAQSRVQPLQLMDIEDYEKLMGLVEAGESLPGMLAHKVNGPYRERDFAAWLHSPGAPSDQARLSVLKQRWQAMAERVTLLSDQAARVGSGDGDDGNPPAD
jgi:hypothetical protein